MDKNLKEAKRLTKELDDIFNEYHDKIDALINPYVKYLRDVINTNPDLTAEKFQEILMRLPSGFARSELRAYYYSLHPKND